MTKQLLYNILFILLLLCGNILKSQAQNNPYVDNKLIHFGFFLELDVLSYLVVENDSLTQLQ